MTKICLNMIVKNESKIITRLFDTVLPIIDYWIISDTGSTDNTKEIIYNYFKEKNIEGKIVEHQWKNFGHNRSLALKEAQQSNFDFDYILLLDADMKLVIGKNFDKNKLKDDVYNLKQGDKNLSYYNVRLIKKTLNATCVCPTHEYYDIKGENSKHSLSDKLLFIDDIGDGGAKSDKYERDIKLLTEGIKEEPNNPRYYFYLAQSYRCVGKNKEAIENYLMRIKKGGWYEEIWYSYYQIGNMYMEMKEEDRAIHYYLMAYSINQGRVENIHKIAEYYRNQCNYVLANHFADMGLNILKTKTSSDESILFKVPPVYNYLLLYEKSIDVYYSNDPNKLKIGLEISNHLMLNRYKLGVETNKYNMIVSNMKFYLPTFEKIGGKHSKQYTNFSNIGLSEDFKNFYNPSITKINGEFYINVRNSNYFMEIKNNSLTYKVYKNNELVDINNNNPVITNNIFCKLNSNLDITNHNLINTDNFSELFKYNFSIKGIEDVRIIQLYDKLYFIGNSREVSEDNSPKMILGEYDYNNNIAKNMVLLYGYEDNKCQKNWSPFIYEGKLLFLYSYSPLTILEPNLNTGECKVYKKSQQELNYDFLRGGSQGFYAKGNLYFLTHEVIYEYGRIYLHRFVKLDNNLNIDKISYPFFMKKQGIEYISGATYNDTTNEVLISWGSDDKCANLSSINLDIMFI